MAASGLPFRGPVKLDDALKACVFDAEDVR